MKKGKPKISRINAQRRHNNLEKLGNEEYRDQRTHLYGRNRVLLEIILRRRSTVK
jgi:hypothetical protein